MNALPDAASFGKSRRCCSGVEFDGWRQLRQFCRDTDERGTRKPTMPAHLVSNGDVEPVMFRTNRRR
jgi:hypothetical protein